MTPQQFSKAIGLVESDGNPNAPLGDHGLAIGRFQMHPAWIYDHILKPFVSESLDSWGERMVEAFYVAHDYLPPVECAMWYHLGHRSMVSEIDWDADYAKRFNDRSLLV